jgi:hypothetical protein
MSHAKDLSANVALLFMADDGQLDSLPCPDCGNDSVSVWFTLPAVDEYRTWFTCTNCAFELRVQNSKTPNHFSKLRVNKQLEALDADILRNRRL